MIVICSRKKVEEYMVCGKLEIDILNSFWNLTANDEDRDISIQDIVDELALNGIERAYTTIKTVMDRLTVKSVLVRYKVGKKFYYKATMNRNEMAMDAVKTVAEQFFNGNYVELIKFVEKNTQNVLV
uniref:BlaI/MecI/CopY family transcriptional regulator n=1 Tax=Candidatus Stercorousia sp. TaxID=3048886 RepID=UPI0040282D03